MRKLVTVIAIAVLVLGGVATGVYFLTRGGDPAPSSVSGQTSAGPPTPGPGSGGPGTVTAPTTPGSSNAPEAEISNARMVAEKAVQAINARDPQAIKQLSCDPAAIGPADNTPPDARAELLSAPELTGDTATVELKLTIGEASTTTPLPLRKRNGTWCVD